MNILSRKPRPHTPPHDAPTPVGVNVTATRREAEPDGTPSANLIALRHAAVLAQEADFLADRSHATEPPDMHALIEALRFVVERLRDGVVVA